MERSEKMRIRLFVVGLAALLLALGCAAGVLIGRVAWPGGGSNAAIANLGAGSKEEYIALVAAGYAQDGNLEKAQARLDQLQAPNVRQWVGEVADKAIGEGRDEAELRALVALAGALGVNSPRMVAFLPSPTPLPTHTPPPTATPLPPTATATAAPPTETPTPEPTQTETPVPEPTQTETPEPTATPAPPTATPKPKATSRPKPTATPTATPAPKWTWTAQLIPLGQEGQQCDAGNLMLRVLVLNADGAQMNGVWIYDKYSQQYQVTGNVPSPDWGPGETKFEYGKFGGGSLCVAGGQGGPCVSEYTRDMPCFVAPPVQDLWAAGYCNCCEAGASVQRCQELIQSGVCMGGGFGHFSWRVVFKRTR